MGVGILKMCGDGGRDGLPWTVCWCVVVGCDGVWDEWTWVGGWVSWWADGRAGG